MKFNTVFYKDSRSMREVDSDSIRLIITSPPYWNTKDYTLDGKQEKRHSRKVKGQIGDIRSYKRYIRSMTKTWKECHRILKPNGKLCINSPLMPILKDRYSTHYNRDIFDINSDISHDIQINTRFFLYDTYIWNRTNWSKKLMYGSYPYPPNFYAQNKVEFIAVFVKDGKPEQIPKEIKERSKLTKKEWLQYTDQIWQIAVPGRNDTAFGKHAAIMPEEIVRRLVKMFSFREDIILDPFCGSGTTLKVASELGRRYIGYEICPVYKKVIEEKLAKILLFGGE